jgi:hypothetical protein
VSTDPIHPDLAKRYKRLDAALNELVDGEDALITVLDRNDREQALKWVLRRFTAERPMNIGGEVGSQNTELADDDPRWRAIETLATMDVWGNGDPARRDAVVMALTRLCNTIDTFDCGLNGDEYDDHDANYDAARKETRRAMKHLKRAVIDWLDQPAGISVPTSQIT